MGLLLSVLVGCVGVLELLECFRQVSNGAVISLDPPPAPCLSYHDPTSDNLSTHDSLCAFSHSAELDLSRDARHRLENLHEYSLRVRSELRRLDKNFDASTLSECSTNFLYGSRPDSRLSLVFNDDRDQREKSVDSFSSEIIRIVDSRPSNSNLVPLPEPDSYVRIPTPIPLGLAEEVSRSNSSSDCEESYDNDSGNEAPTKTSIDALPVLVRRYRDSIDASSIDESDHGGSRFVKRTLRRFLPRSRSPATKSCKLPVEGSPSRDAKVTEDLRYVALRLASESEPEVIVEKLQETITTTVSQKKPRSSKQTSSILRKPTRLKSKNAEVSKSAENLSTRGKSKRQREPERRKSDISIQAGGSLYRDESTNTSPPDSELSRSESRGSAVSVQVQTSFEEKLADDEETFQDYEASILGLSEGSKDLGSRSALARRSFRCKRFRSWVKESSDEGAPSTSRPPKVSQFEEATLEDYDNARKIVNQRDQFEDDDEEFASAEEGKEGPIEFAIPDPDQSKAFWLIFSGEYTKAMNKEWHSGHFCCWQCDESLTGQRYVLRDEHPYCIKCYESVFANGCEECNKIIGIDSKDLSYKDKHWHEACFLCNRCRVSLVDKQFGSKVDKIYCGNCYDAQFASRCDGCGEIFRAGTKKMEYKTRQWHEKCFCCVVCKNPFGTNSFIPREQEIYCTGCYEDKFATRCVKCNQVITSNGVTYKNAPWHKDCFTCVHCNQSLAGKRFTSRDEKPYCADCFAELFAKRCISCSKPITGIGGTRFISFQDRHWHNDCFICAGCKTSLVGRGFITDGEDIICPECAKQKLM